MIKHATTLLVIPETSTGNKQLIYARQFIILFGELCWLGLIIWGGVITHLTPWKSCPWATLCAAEN